MEDNIEQLSKANGHQIENVSISMRRHRGVKSSDADTKALAKQGKQQQLNRSFGFIAAIAFSSILLTSWEALAATIGAGFENGGPVALIYGFILSWTGTMTLCLSLAEMTSMAPVSSVQYHYVALLTQGTGSHLLSWIAGWLTVFAWQANIASVGYLTSSQIQALAILNNESYSPQAWHGVMIFWAVVLMSTVVNIFGIKMLPHLETTAGILHVGLWFVFLITLVYLSPQRSAAEVFTEFENNSGWNNDAVSWCLGLLTVTYPLIGKLDKANQIGPESWANEREGFEGVGHISEEIENATLTVPRSMVLALGVNGLLSFGMLLGMLFSARDIQRVLQSPTGSPCIQLVYDALESKSATTAMMGLVVALALCSEMGMVASTSRLTWSFARDNGLPLSRVFARVNHTFGIPVNAVLLNAIIAMLLNLIIIASDTAFSAIISLTTITLYASYVLPIAIMIVRRLQGSKIPFGPFSLGRFGLLVNILGVCWGLFTISFVVLPKEMPVTTTNMNYASVVFISAFLCSLLLWILYGRKTYYGPVNEIPIGDIALE